MNKLPQQTDDSTWPHRLAVLLVCATFPLIWVGGLVTTYDAGMAVPDWPTTYGYNLFLYPWQTWLLGPWDLFIEHGHRLLGALVGVITIGFVAAVFRCDERRWLRRAALVALGLVIFQGILGGARVLLDERQLAMIHGCVGPLFFAYCVALAVVTSRRWKEATAKNVDDRASRLHRVSLLTMLFSYLQLVIGAQLRHVSVMASPNAFRVAVLFHLVVAAVVLFHVFQLLTVVLSDYRSAAALRCPAIVLSCLIVMQLALGAGTWVVKYGWPEFMAQFQFAAAHTVHAKSMLQALVVTAHVATGSLILGFTVALFARSIRLVRVPTAALGSSALMMELAT